MQCSMCSALGSMQKQGATFVCKKFPSASHDGNEVKCTAKGCNFNISPWIEQKDEKSGKLISERFCDCHWALAYGLAFCNNRLRKCMHHGCTNDELQAFCLSQGENKKMQLSWMYQQGPC